MEFLRGGGGGSAVSGNGGNGASASLINAVDGQTSGDLTLALKFRAGAVAAPIAAMAARAGAPRADSLLPETPLR